MSFELSGLSISLRGSPARAAEFLREVAAPSPEPPSRNDSVVSWPPSTPAGSGILGTCAERQFESRSSIASTLAPVPAHYFGSIAPTLVGSQLSGIERAQRAWSAGAWAKAVGEGRIGTPNRSRAIDLPNRFWCVLYCERLASPKVYTSSRNFFRGVGRVEGSSTLCHGFPTEAESRLYFEAAGVDFPLSFD